MLGRLRSLARTTVALARRWPLVSLIAAVVSVMGLSLVPDLCYAIPWPWRKAAGWVGFGFVAAAGFVRLGRVLPGDDRWSGARAARVAGPRSAPRWRSRPAAWR